MSTAREAAFVTSILFRMMTGVTMLYLSTLTGKVFAQEARLHVQSNLRASNCEVQVGEENKVLVRDAIPAEFATVNTAGMLGFQVRLTNCNGVKAGSIFSIRVSGDTLTGHPDIFNKNAGDDVGFMLKENPNGTTNYWPGSKETFYTDPGTVTAGSDTWTGTKIGEDDPQDIRLNYFVGVVTPTPGAVAPGPRVVNAEVTFSFDYR
ncbi:fimbrial protein [Serratia sp. 2723]|uniref:fimbrial protein n=1 Tax=unclassified Serratia (in: enterobacteria) TaxID=2647522 RepID=UPI003D2241C4